MLRVITCNVNGLRSAERKGFFKWLQTQKPDIVCLQETKWQLHEGIGEAYQLPGYTSYFHNAQKKGYSGVAIYTHLKPSKVVQGLGWSHADDEGRYIELEFDKFRVASLYMPSGAMGDARQAIKFDFMKRYWPILESRKKHAPFIICGDWNIVHKEIDIKNFKTNQKTSGCLPEEREWIDHVFTKLGWVDAFRVLNKEPHQYTWWSHRANAWANNVGWRIDYQIVTPDLQDKIKAVKIYRDEKFSDHAPLIVDYKI